MSCDVCRMKPSERLPVFIRNPIFDDRLKTARQLVIYNLALGVFSAIALFLQFMPSYTVIPFLFVTTVLPISVMALFFYKEGTDQKMVSKALLSMICLTALTAASVLFFPLPYIKIVLLSGSLGIITTKIVNFFEHPSFLLYHAVVFNCHTIARFALSLGADPNKLISFGCSRYQTPLMRAVKRNNLSMTRLLLDSGGHVGAYVNEGILNHAVKNLSASVVDLLLKKGARCDQRLREFGGQTAFNMAMIMKFKNDMALKSCFWRFFAKGKQKKIDDILRAFERHKKVPLLFSKSS